MLKTDKATHFHTLHVKGTPLKVYNVWDAGSAQAVVNAGASSIATSSWSLAEAQGYRDGEEMPLNAFLTVIERITATIDVPVSVDFEGGFSENNDNELRINIARLIDLGVSGINFEDRIVKGNGLYRVEAQAQRIQTIRNIAEEKGVNLFINARTDLFLNSDTDPAQSIDEALERAQAYTNAGASGFFIPGLINSELIARICKNVELPVNVMQMNGAPSIEHLAALGVARISFGGMPYSLAMQALSKNAAEVYA